MYESLPAPASAEQSDPPLPNPRTAFLKVEFHKVVSKTFEIQRAEETEIWSHVITWSWVTSEDLFSADGLIHTRQHAAFSCPWKP
jgi:hypothetical protein